MSDYFGSRGSFRSRSQREDVDPMTSMSGIGDVMLVFACGLMTALVVAWNVNLSEFSQVELGEEIEDVQDFVGEQTGGNSTYIEMGTVYQDAATGQYYLLEDEVGSKDDEADAEEDTEAEEAGQSANQPGGE